MKVNQTEIAIPTPETKQTRLTKTVSKQLIRETLITGTFNRAEICQKLNLKDRTIRRYLNEIAKEESQQNPELLHVLRSVCIKNLMHKAVKKQLSDRYQVAIVLSGETQKIEQHITEKVDVNVTKTEQILKQYELIIRRGQANPLEPIPHDDSAEQVHPT